MTDRYYGYYDSPIGLLEIICTDEALVSALFVTERQFEEDSHPLVDKALKQFDDYFKGERRDFDLPLSFGGTIFQKSVWEGLTKIPYGETWSYKQLATALGNEKATRAVGNANSKNLISIVVPCHRVIGANKTLTGYAGGLDRKQWLLDHEKI